MAWQSYLSLDGLRLGTWFNGAERACALLFKSSDLKIDGGTVRLVTRVQESLRLLEGAGFSWQLVVRDYAEAREQSVEAAFLLGAMSAKLAPDQYQKFEADLQAALPGDELAEMAELVLRQAAEQQAWLDEHESGERDTSLVDVLLYHSYDAVGSAASLVAGPRQASLCRPLEYLLGVRRESPSIGWLLMILTVLHRANPDGELVLDITDGASSACSKLSPEEFGADFWESAHTDLERSATFYGRVFASIASVSGEFGRSALYGTLSTALHNLACSGVPNAERGRRLEDFFAGLVELCGGGLRIMERNLKHDGEELDLVLRNDLADPFWRNFNSPVVLVECKNWSTRVDVNELRVLQTKMSDRGRLCSIGIFVGINGFTRPFLDRVRDLQIQGITIFPIELTDMEAMVRTRTSLTDWLRNDGLRRIL